MFKKILPYKYRVYINIVVTALLPLLILGGFSYYTFMKETSEKVDTANTTLAEQSLQQTDYILNTIKNYYIAESTVDEINWFVNSGEVNYRSQSELSKLTDSLSGKASIAEYINGYSLISFRGDWLISNRGMHPYSETKNLTEVESVINKYKESGTRIQFLNRMDYPQLGVPPSGHLNLSGYYLVLRLPTVGIQTSGVMMIQINTSFINKLMSSASKEYSIVVMDSSGKTLYSNDMLLSGYCSKNFAYDEFKSPHVAKMENGTKYRISVAESQSNNISVVIGDSQSLMSRSGSSILLMVVVLIIIILCLLLFSQIGTRKLYRPVSQLVKYMNSTTGTKTFGNEFEQIERGVNFLVDNKELLTEKIEDQKKMLLDLFVFRLIRGDINSQQISEMQEQFELTKCKFYVSVSVHFLLNSKLTGEVLTNEAFNLFIMERIQNNIKDMLYFPQSLRGEAILMVMAADSEKELEDKCWQLHNFLEALAVEDLNTNVTTGVSGIFSDLLFFRKHYNESVEAIKSDIFTEKNKNRCNIIFFSDIVVAENSVGEYSRLLEQETLNAIDHCDYVKAFECTDIFVDHLLSNKLSQQEQELWLNRYIVAILLILNNAGIAIKTVFGEDNSGIFTSLKAIIESSSLKKFIREEIATPVIKALEEFREDKSEEIYNQILELVVSKKGNITLAECAYELGYHSSYVWKILKKEGNTTFTDFVANEKIKEAKNLLLNTSKSIGDIANELEYTNAQNFIRFFSRHENITPGKYRSSHKDD